MHNHHITHADIAMAIVRLIHSDFSALDPIHE